MDGAIDIIPTVVPRSLADIAETGARYASFAQKVQIDVADGRFAPDETWLPEKNCELPQGPAWEAHMMAEEPGEVGARFARAGATTLIAHVEALPDPPASRELFLGWRADGAREIGVAALFRTPLERLAPHLPFADFILLMTIQRIGAMGIPYEPSAPQRVAECRAMYPDVLVGVDGGIAESNIADLARAGARRFCVGSAIANSDNPAETYTSLKRIASFALS